MPELHQQFQILAAIEGLTALFWIGSALVALARYRGFEQPIDLGWASAFLALAVTRAGYVLVALRYSDAVTVAPTNAADLTRLYSSYGVRLAAIQMATSLGVFFLFRARRRTF